MPKKINPIGSGKPDISAVDAAITKLTEDLSELRGELTAQRGEGRNIIIGVLIAFILIVATVAIEVILAHLQPEANNLIKQLELSAQINSQQAEINTVRTQLDSLKARNPYLK